MSPAKRPTLTLLRNDDAHPGQIDHGLWALLNHAYDTVRECRKAVSESRPVPAELTERLSSINDGIREATMNVAVLTLDPTPGTLRTRPPQRLARHLHPVGGGASRARPSDTRHLQPAGDDTS